MHTKYACISLISETTEVETEEESRICPKVIPGEKDDRLGMYTAMVQTL